MGEAGEAFTDVFEHPAGGGAVGVGEDHGELVSPVAADHVRAAEALLQEHGEVSEQPVAGRVAVLSLINLNRSRSIMA